VSTITKISDELWDNISDLLPNDKPKNTVGRSIIPFRKVMDGILYVLRTGCQWKMLPKEYGSGSTCHRRFQQWVQLDIFKKIWIRLLKEYDNKIGIKLIWNQVIANLLAAAGFAQLQQNGINKCIGFTD